jgi:hypothetical protein
MNSVESEAIAVAPGMNVLHLERTLPARARCALLLPQNQRWLGGDHG